MKILCLHPWGTSGFIFEKQLQILSGILGPTHEYVYINGGVPSARARDLPDFVKGPYYCWYEGLSSPQCQEAHDTITETIKEEGPFDGVIGFSQGASLALSFLLHRELHSPDLPCPFRFALLFCANLVISPDSKFNHDKVVKYSGYYKASHNGVRSTGEVDAEGEEHNDGDNDDEHKTETGEGNGTHQTTPATPPTPDVSSSKRKTAPKHRALLLLPGRKKALVEELVDLIDEASRHVSGEADASTYSWPENGKPEDFPRLMHPLTVKARVPIPTVHVIAQNDPLMRHSELAVRLCDKKKTKLVYFDGAHRIPTAPSTLNVIARAVEWAMQKGQLM
ncbi:serine hydrolase-domain-containing protein [Chaetomium tenue]|uniref:Serine hydrolase-domain-containing protein n=1 Tax=Chaetomium tenue TaxID=1854479 RepID=A0ACB7PBT4_9PEZI|nr:serine hydrolase-domain-containing protein [Chaetomium globosum]